MRTGKKLWKPFFLILILSLITISTQTKYAHAQLPVMSVSPDPNTYEVGDYFDVALYIAGVQSPGAASWDITLKFDSTILTVEDVDNDVTEGWWLSQDGFFATAFSATPTAQGIIMACYMTEDPGDVAATDEGELAYVHFKVIGPGKTAITLANTKLRDTDVVEIDHDVMPGTFYTDQPKADFKYSFEDQDLRDSPVVGQTITFNATHDPLSQTGSYDPNPGGELTMYTWDFGDNTPIISYVKDVNLTDITTHAYTLKGDYQINLTVTDNALPNHLRHTRILLGFHVAQRDVAITGMKISPAVAEPGSRVAINVTVKNLGTESEYFNVTLYYDDTMIYYNVTPGYIYRTAYCLALENGTDPRPPGIPLGPGKSLTIRFNWTTTGVPEASYAIRANVSIIPLMASAYNETLKNVEVDYTNNEKFGTAIITSEPINIAITDITVSPKVLATGQGPASISVEIENQGNIEETFSLSVFYNLTLIENRTDISLAPFSSTTEVFTLDTASLTNGTYIIIANASLVLGEMLTEDNSFTYPDNVIISHVPIASFTSTPEAPRVGDTVSFNASGSSDPDGNITDYIWGFGDGTALTHGKTTTHIYLQAKTYDLNLTVIDNVGLNTTLTTQITIDKATSNITLLVSPTTLTFGSQVTINGKISPPRSQVDAVIMFRVEGDLGWSDLPSVTVKTNATGHYSSSWAPPGAKAYQIQTHWSGDVNTYASFSAIANITVNKIGSEITSLATPKTVTVGSGVTVTGKITPTRSGVIVTIQARLEGETESAVGTTATDSTGSYSLTWTPEEAGTYEVRAIWGGDDNTISDQSEWETVTVNEAESPIPWYYIVGGVAAVVIIIAVAVYFLKIRKP